MKEKIIEHLKRIEKENKIKILFAVESGSRLWRIASKDSDYDIRFVFVQRLDNYLGLRYANTKDKVINFEDKENNLDFSGFDIYKFMKLIEKSNPSVIEWLQSDLVYYGEQPKKIKELLFKEFNPVALYYHYASMCRQNYEKYLRSGKEITYKKYLYAMRGLINSRWVEKTKKLPLISFPKQIKESKGIVPNKILNELNNTITKKSSGDEKDIIKNHNTYDLFIEEFLNSRGKLTSHDGKRPNERKLNLLFLDIVCKKGPKVNKNKNF